MIHNKDSPRPPSNSLRVVYPLGGNNGPLCPVYHFIIARTRLGTIPGFFNGRQGFYAYAGKERATDDFDWIVIEEEKKQDIVKTNAEPNIEKKIGIAISVNRMSMNFTLIQSHIKAIYLNLS